MTFLHSWCARRPSTVTTRTSGQVGRIFEGTATSRYLGCQNDFRLTLGLFPKYLGEALPLRKPARKHVLNTS